MIELNALFSSIDKFYKESLLRYSQNTYLKMMLKYGASSFTMPDDAEGDIGEIPTSSEGILQAAENLSYDIDNENLLNQFDSLLNTYKDFLKSLDVKPDNFNKNPEEAAIENIGDIAGLIDTLNTRWQRLTNNPYLTLTMDDENYTENFSPEKILNLAQAMVKNANDALEQRAEETGFTTEELTQAQQAAEQFNNPQFDKRDQNLTISGDRVKQQLEANKRQLDKLRFIKKVGPTHPDWHKVEKMRQDSIARFRAMLNDPARKQVYLDKAKSRQQTRRTRDRKVMQHFRENEIDNLISELQTTKSDSKKHDLIKELIRIEEQVLENKGLNLEDPYVRNSPEVQSALNPLKIIEKYKNRFNRIQEERKKEVAISQKARELGRQSGDLVGLTEIFRDNLATVVSELKKKFQRYIEKNGPNDPVFKPYFDKINAAKDEQSKAIALKEMMEKARSYKEEQAKPLQERLEPLEKIKKELMELTAQTRPTKTQKAMKKNPWLFEEKIPEDKKLIIQQLISKIDQAAGQFGDVSGANLSGILNSLSQSLKSKIS